MTEKEERDIIAIKSHFKEVIELNNALLMESRVDKAEIELELKNEDVRDSKVFVSTRIGQNAMASSIIKELDSFLDKYRIV